MSNDAKIPDGDDQFTGSNAAGSVEDEPNGKGTAGQDAQKRRNKDDLEDDPSGKGTAGQDAQGRRNKGDVEDDQVGKGTAGQDAQGRRN